MRCSYGVSFAEPPEAIWASLADVDGYLAARPGVTLVHDGDAVAGSLKCTLGSAQITYRLSAGVTVDAAEPHTAVIVVTGREARGSGTLGATLTAAVRPEGAGSRLEISGDIQATGRGETADEQAWSRVFSKLLDPQDAAPAPPAEVVTPAPTFESAPAEPAPAAPPRPALAVAPDSGDFSPESGWSGPPPQALVALAVVVLFLIGRRRKRRRRQGDTDDGQ
jgi:uncharacterized protein